MVESLRQNKALLERVILAMVLPGVAGAVNAAGFFAVGSYTSHVTGNVARIGDELASGHLWLAVRAAILVAAFFLGALISTLLILHGRRAGGSPYWRALLAECALVFVFATVSVGSEHRAHLNSLEMTALICVAMGVQNAMVTKLSGAAVRNTHMTGITTDIGIEFGRILYDLLHPEERSVVQRRRLRLHVAVLVSFLSGATVGPALYLVFGHLGMLVPCAVLLALAAFDGYVGLTAHSLTASVE
jgi:uncharacterized membrane protein YoaK (UPF0700 family)